MAEPTTPDEQEINLRPVGPDDDDFLLEVYAGTRAGERAFVDWSDEQWDAFVRMQYTAQRTDYEARLPDSEHSVVIEGGRPVGRIWVHRTDEKIKLVDIAIHPAHQRRGIGTLLIRRLIDEARLASKSLTHMVHQFNGDAIRFYERLGFSITDRTPTHFIMEQKPGG